MSSEAKPLTMELDLEWEGGLRFKGSGDDVAMDFDTAGHGRPTPVDALAFSLAGCMAMDVVSILTRGRQPLRALRTHLSAERSPTSPKRFTAITLHFLIEGAVAADRVERALKLSRDTYCSVWQSLRQDIEFRTSYQIAEPPGRGAV